MTLVQLQYVLAVAEYKNFTIAADKSFVTQPTLSMQIQKLEKELNIEIFDRTSHPIKITQIGAKIVAQAKTILMEANRMKHLVNEEKGLLEGDFIIGVIPTILPSLVPLFYKTFQKNNPKSNLIIKELQTDKIIKGIKDGSLDFGLVVSPLYEDQIIERPLYYEPLVAYIPPVHRLGQNKTITQEDLDTADLLILQEGHCFRNNVLALCDTSNLKQRPIKLESGSFDVLIKLANDGFGMTLLPSLVADDLPEELRNNIKNFKSPVPSREVSLIFHQSQLRDSFEKELVNTIQSILRGKIFLEKDEKLDANIISLTKK
ncbi:LysR substrate-binding domain-containing protein [Faecalibacter rhinopitheci]|uniref:LysR family transcriptional regulator n=1 Tax=Faecalibacter rhinopitheci TaxID=2779678 RepID=A0A8J7FSF5_9FLAO|nr:LysR substrate-binding domain-containing protein [Faecalibacter rhinopitheci]MBF0598095.1 LysR family transcriptional regulator [Faecalibacter rhinopitheci]MBQ0148110.1 LysR family transcriptional regulator [Candidatus Onthonaster equi]